MTLTHAMRSGLSMTRKPRFNLIEIPQHVIQRGNNREYYFYANVNASVF